MEAHTIDAAHARLNQEAPCVLRMLGLTLCWMQIYALI